MEEYRKKLAISDLLLGAAVMTTIFALMLGVVGCWVWQQSRSGKSDNQ